MASLTIRNLADDIKAGLRLRAASHGWSMEEEARQILKQAVQARATETGLGSLIHRRFAAIGGGRSATPGAASRPPAARSLGYGRGMILLDTNVLSELMKARPATQVLAWRDRQPRGDLYTSAITRAEIELGIALLPQGRQRDGLARAARRCSRRTSPAPYWRSTTKLQCTMPG